MTDAGLTVADDLVVSLAYTLRLEDGEVIDTSPAHDREPLEFVQGQEQIIPGLEQALYGMALGDEKEVVVAPIDGYGEHDPEAFEMVERHIFPAEMTLEPGMSLRVRESSGEILDATVVDVRPEGILLDFNHPLAGETLYFQVKIAGLRTATEEELAHGHVHGPGHEH
jgi:FKBP-type peptidyl-prolyl cis-trans isomerase SlyD